jgi:hypothetical protein
VDGQELLIKGNSATQRYVEAYEQEKTAARAKAAKERLEVAKKKQEEGEVGEQQQSSKRGHSITGKQLAAAMLAQEGSPRHCFCCQAQLYKTRMTVVLSGHG